MQPRREDGRDGEEPRRSGFCCGAGGGRIFLEETIGKRVNVERTEQAIATGARTVAVGCPFCMTMITDGTKAKNVEGAVQVKDLAELVAERLRPEALPWPARDDSRRLLRRPAVRGARRRRRAPRAPRAARGGPARAARGRPRRGRSCPSPRGRRSREELLRVHTAAHVDRVAAARGTARPLRPRHRRRARGRTTRPLAAAGAVVDAVEARARRRARPGLLRRAPARPPRDTATGPWASACSTTSRSAPPRPSPAACKRVAVIDFDVHHGNGTQDIFYGDPRVLFVSSHQFPFYPGRAPSTRWGRATAGASPSTCRCRPAGRRASTQRLPRDRRADRPAPSTPSSSSSRPASTRTAATRSAGMDVSRGRLRGADGRVRGRGRGRRPGAASWPSSRAATTSTALAEALGRGRRAAARDGPPRPPPRRPPPSPAARAGRSTGYRRALGRAAGRSLVERCDCRGRADRARVLNCRFGTTRSS